MKLLRLDSEFIWNKDIKKKNQYLVFRKNFYVDEFLKEANIYIAVDTKYWLYVNGVRKVFDGGLFRESMKDSGYADKIDISNELVKGKNLIALLVHYYGNEGRNSTDSKSAGLLVYSKDLDIRSDETFKCLEHPSYYMTDEPNPSYLFGGYNLGYNANFEIDRIFENDFDDSAFENATVYDKSFFGDIYERPIPFFKLGKLVKGKILINGVNKYEVSLPYAMHLHPCFSIIGKKNTILDIRTDRYHINGGPGSRTRKGGMTNIWTAQRIEYILKDGINVFESDKYLFGEKIYFTSSEPIEIQWFGYRESGYDSSITGEYNCDCKVLNRLVKKSARTLYVCMRENFMDCPDRERGQWIGDVSVQAPQVPMLFNQNAMKLLRKAVCDFINLRKGKVLVGNVPGANYSELPPQSLNAISEVGLISNYYKYSGDREILELAFNPCVEYLNLWKISKDGLLEHRDGDWNWFDHLFNIDKPVLENAWYYSALKFAQQMAKRIDNHKYDDFLADRINSIKSAFNKSFWKGHYYASSEFVDDRANAMAVIAGLNEEEYNEAIKNVLLTVFNASAYMENYVLSALCEMKFYKDAHRRMVSRYYNLSANENSTLWEDFYLLGTKNHAWTGSPATIAFKYFIGIDTNDGFNTYTINPVHDLFELQKVRFLVKDKIVQVIVKNNEINIEEFDVKAEDLE